MRTTHNIAYMVRGDALALLDIGLFGRNLVYAGTLI